MISFANHRKDGVSFGKIITNQISDNIVEDVRIACGLIPTYVVLIGASWIMHQNPFLRSL